MAGQADALVMGENSSDDVSDHERARADFAAALEAGLSSDAEKSIPCRFLYDARGSELFEEITVQPEYYPTRTEAAILADCAGEIANMTDSGTVLLEFGSGSSQKTEILLDALQDKLAAYVPLDISKAALDDAVARLSDRYPELRMLPIAGDFAKPVKLPPHLADEPHLGFFPGSTIGNLEPDDAVAILESMRETLQPDGRLVIGTDLVKPLDRLVPAYNDAAGVTARFNLNVLERANRELGTDFDTEAFRHAAIWNDGKNRIEMHLVSLRDQTVNGLSKPITIAAGEHLHTENSHKYTREGFKALAARAGWTTRATWTDRDDLFAVHVLVSQ